MSENQTTPAVTPAAQDLPKPVEAKPETTAITTPDQPKEGQGLATVKNGAIGSTTVKAEPKSEKPAKKAEEPKTTALFSEKSYHWVENGGALKKGYNIVEDSTVDNWLTLEGVRRATVEELREAFKGV